MKLLDFRDTREILKNYGIPLIRTEIIESKKQALDFVKKHKYPVVLKVFSPDVLHRTEKGMTEIVDANISKSYDRLDKKAPKNGFLIIQDKGKGIPIICGMKRDPVFGPVIMFGLGGMFVELIKDVSFAIGPLNKVQALEMIKRIQGYDVLKGFRNKKGINLNKMADILVNLSCIAEDYPEIKEIDFNPVFASHTKVVVADPNLIL